MTDSESSSATNFLTFDQFDRELRDALSKQDAVALAFLVKFPLRVNHSGGTISLDDPAALQSHFQEVFTAAVRKQVLRNPDPDTFCNSEGLSYRAGVIWVNADEHGYAIWAVNPDPIPPPARKWDTPKVMFVCQTEKHRAAVDWTAGRKLRYRVWNKPKSVTAKPDLEVVGGKETFEGTQVCTVPTYTFKNGTTVYQVDDGLGCFADPGPPTWATGRLEVTMKDGQSTESWCY